MRFLIATSSVLALAACDMSGTDRVEAEQNDFVVAQPQDDNLADSMRSDDPASGQAYRAAIPDAEERPVMQAQVVLDRIGFGPGVIDGRMGLSTENALTAFQETRGFDTTGELDEATKAALAEWVNIPATRVVTIPANWGTLDYEEVPEDPAEQANMERLGYESLDERLAERFHTTVETLQMLNPDGRPAGASASASAASKVSASSSPSASPTVATMGSSTPTPSGNARAARSIFAAGQQIRVPNIGADRIAPGVVDNPDWQQTLAMLGVGTEQPKVARVVVDESEKWLRGYDAQDNLVVAFTVSSGSRRDPLPLGEWGITGVGRNPTFSYNPELFWDVPDTDAKQQLPPGPNGPVGVVWIDLTKEHYGIHGTPAPETIGRAQSHGCVRLTNWDAARLAGMVSQSTKVIFQS